MTRLDHILMGMVADHINFGADKESDDMFKDDLKQAKKEIKDLIREYLTGEIPDWDYEYSMCNSCDFQPTDDTQNCLCIYRNKLRDEVKERISTL